MGQSPEETRYLIHTFGRDTYNQYFQDELPRYKVCLNGFWMGKTEVTRGQFKKFIAAHNYQTDAEISGSVWTYNKFTNWAWKKVSGCTWKNPVIDADPLGRGFHVNRCGGWNSIPGYLRTAGRSREKATFSSSYLGIRLCITSRNQ